MSQIKNISLISISIVVLIAIFGCGTANKNNVYDPATGHPANWDHGSAYLSDTGSCTTCHGSDLMGGTSKVSCYSDSYNGQSCHSAGPGGHPSGWSLPENHGLVAKSAPSGNSGFSSCKSCHGSSFNGGSVGVSCFTCHGVDAPHPKKPWRDTTYTHTTTDTGNAPVCADCHRNPNAPPSEPPDCFNNTLCHGSRTAHPNDWALPENHGITAEADFSACKTCHGSSYTGGTAGVSCYACHNGPGLDHPTAGYVISNHVSKAQADITLCKKCHGTDYSGGGSGTACTKCHMESETKTHILSWYPDISVNHRDYAKTNGTSKCSNQYCHGTDLKGVSGSGPSCSSCHTWPYTAPTCTTCHGTPPDGTTPPNTAGRHSVHTAFQGVNCATCHLGAGSGTTKHQNGVVDIIINSVYNAKSGTPSYDSTQDTCSKISCHGGQTTPNWITGSIDINQCSLCHSYGTTEYNSYYSGKHYKHVVEKGKACTDCHDTTLLQNYHFNDLSTPAMTEADFTIKSSIGYNGTTCATPGCHGQKTWW